MSGGLCRLLVVLPNARTGVRVTDVEVARRAEVTHSGIEPPRPDEAADAAQFVAQLRALRLWSGLTYRQVAARAEALGEVLPASTIASALGRSRLPRRELVVALGSNK